MANTYPEKKLYSIGNYQVDLSDVPEEYRQQKFQKLVNLASSDRPNIETHIRNLNGKIVSGSQTYTGPGSEPQYTSPNIVSSEAARDKTTKNVADLNNITNPPEGSQPGHWNEKITPITGKTGQTDSQRVQDFLETDPLAVQLKQANDELQANLDNYNTQLDTYKTNLDLRTQQQIDSIKAQFDVRKRQMELINKNTLAGQTLLGVRGGRQRYAPEIQTGILAAEERAGVQRLADLDTQMNAAILAAEQARDDQDYKILNDKMNNVRDLYNAKRQQVLDLNTLVQQENKRLMDKAQESREAQKFEMEQERFGMEKEKFPYEMEQLKTKQKQDTLNLISTEFDLISSIPEGETVTIGGQEFTGIKPPDEIKPFFSGSDIISLMKDIPEGTSQEITDPNTGTKYTLTGTKDPNVVTAINDYGTMYGIDKGGKGILWAVEGVGPGGKPEPPKIITEKGRIISIDPITQEPTILLDLSDPELDEETRKAGEDIIMIKDKIESGAMTEETGKKWLEDQYKNKEGYEAGFFDEYFPEKIVEPYKPKTGAQAQSAAYALRMKESMDILDEVEEKFAGAGSYIGQKLPNIWKSAERQKFEQSKRSFINALLRKESGAQINPDEFKNYEKQYFAQPGDTKEVLAQKKKNRETAYQGMILQANAQGTDFGDIENIDDLNNFNIDNNNLNSIWQ